MGLGRFLALEKSQKMDPHSTGRGVRQFKTNLLRKLQRVDLLFLHLFHCAKYVLFLIGYFPRKSFHLILL